MSVFGKPVRRLINYSAVAVLVIGGVLAPTSPAGAHGQPTVGSVPDTAFLQPEDLNGVTGWRPDAGLGQPVPCGTARYGSNLLRRAEGAMAYDYPVGDFHTMLAEYLTGYRSDGAVRYLRELRAAVAGRGCTDETGQWNLLRTGVAGRDSLLIRLRQQMTGPGGTSKILTSYFVAARTGRIVVVLADVGWEDISGHQSTVLGLGNAALRRASASIGVPSRYRATPIGPEGRGIWALSMNNRDQVVGQWEGRSGVVRPFLWQRGRMVDLGVLSGDPGEMGIATDVNARGDVVGGTSVGTTSHATLWRHGRIIDLGTLGGRSSFAEAINDWGQIVGNSENAAGEQRGFIWQNGRMRDLGIPGPTIPLDINNWGQVTGWSGFGVEGVYRAFLWERGRVTPLSRPPQTYGNQATGINNRGEIVGAITTTADVMRAVRWYRGGMVDLGTLAGGNASGAQAINDLGQIVGRGNVRPYSLEEHPFLYWRGLMWDLSRAGIPDEEAYWMAGINNHGQILGRNAIYRPVPSRSW